MTVLKNGHSLLICCLWVHMVMDAKIRLYNLTTGVMKLVSRQKAFHILALVLTSQMVARSISGVVVLSSCFVQYRVRVLLVLISLEHALIVIFVSSACRLFSVARLLSHFELREMIVWLTTH